MYLIDYEIFDHQRSDDRIHLVFVDQQCEHPYFQIFGIETYSPQSRSAFKPFNKISVEAKRFSASTDAIIKKVCDTIQKVDDENNVGNVTVVVYDWYLGHILEKARETKQAKITFLEPKDPSRSLKVSTHAIW